MREILIPVLIMAGLGLLAGLLLSVVSLVMSVSKGEAIQDVLALLPGANCGACGYAGCDGYAEALLLQEAENGLCSPGGPETAKKVAEVLGTRETTVIDKTALVHCLGSHDNTADQLLYDGMQSCAAALQLVGGIANCRFGCMGLGDCQRACPYGAITLCNGLASIHPALCKGCSLCVAACPKELIHVVPLKKQAVVRCHHCDRGTMANKVCKVSCIACRKCIKICKYDAITIENFHAVVDPAKCTACGACVAACPRACITMLIPPDSFAQ